MASSTEFFSLAAQVIPVGFVAIAFEHRALGRNDEEPEQDVATAAARFWAFLLIMWGEASALSAVSVGHGTARDHGAIVAALIAEAVLLAFEPVTAFFRAGAGVAPSRFEHLAHLLIRFVVLVPAAALAALCVLQIVSLL